MLSSSSNFTGCGQETKENGQQSSATFTEGTPDFKLKVTFTAERSGRTILTIVTSKATGGAESQNKKADASAMSR
jgi:hypothetical protein